MLTLFEELMNITGTPADYEQNEYFMSGKVAMKFGPSNYNKTLKLLTQQEMNLMFIGNPAKSATEGSISGIVGGYSLAIPRGANIEKSWKVIKWWTEKENISKYCELYELLPADTTLWDEDFITSNVFLSDLKEIIPNYKVRPLVKGYSNFETTVAFSAMDELRLKTKTKEQVLQYIKTGRRHVCSRKYVVKKGGSDDIKEKGLSMEKKLALKGYLFILPATVFFTSYPYPHAQRFSRLYRL